MSCLKREVVSLCLTTSSDLKMVSKHKTPVGIVIVSLSLLFNLFFTVWFPGLAYLGILCDLILWYLVHLVPGQL